MEEFSVYKIFENEYTIPIYQRAYAWTENEINTLIDDVYDYHIRGGEQKYYIGSLVVHSDNNGIISVIDGQQRLTTLCLLICYLKNESPHSKLAKKIDVKLNFESRKRSTEILSILKNKDDFEKILDLDNELVDAYRIIRKNFQEKKGTDSSNKFDEEYFNYLLKKVILIKNELPKDTDLNHYFEIMNDRGEQLEKHEIVKAYLLGLLAEEEAKKGSVVSEIWNACQRMDKYVQLGFDPDIRGELFSGTWDVFSPTNFEEVSEAFNDDNSQSVSKSISLDAILEMTPNPDKADETDDTGRYHSIINFPNFILQVLKLYKDKEPFDWNYESRGISLDDKRLVEQFKDSIKSDKDVYEFTYLLLKTRFLFDNYVIKTDSINDNSLDDSNWSLHKPYMLKNGNNRKLSPRNTFSDDNTQDTVVKIESMFQVTDPRQIYKSFLFGLLQILNDDTVLKDKDLLIKKLIAFASQRFISLTRDSSVFDRGVNTPNYIFNFLDFVLWYNETQGTGCGVNASDFDFKYRNSVEHFYPQNPNEREGHKRLDPEILNNFGNLCIMSRGHNSLRSNLMPDAKIKEFKSTDQSLKFELMQQRVEVNDDWGTVQIKEHGEKMKNILTDFIKSIEA
ncbi:GmrSD restriction endonuclease domain-containing protein [Peptostreptococcus stomatis]